MAVAFIALCSIWWISGLDHVSLKGVEAPQRHRTDASARSRNSETPDYFTGLPRGTESLRDDSCPVS